LGEGGRIVVTTDGGANWFFQASPTMKNLYTVSFFQDGTGMAYGDSTAILKYFPDGIVSAETIESNSKLSISPNPANASVSLNLPDDCANGCRICVYNSTGELVLEKAIAGMTGRNSQSQLNIESFPAGIYFVAVKSQRQTYTEKLNIVR
jgi:hypothetical protein